MKENDDIGMSMKTQDKQRLQEMLFYGEIDGVFVNGLFDEESFESVHSLTEDIVILSHQDFKFIEDGCPTLIVNSDTTCMYRNKTFEVAKDKGCTDPKNNGVRYTRVHFKCYRVRNGHECRTEADFR